MGDLSKNFSSEEFACKCNQCGGLAVMKVSFIEMLQRARDFAGVSFRITSGYRCPRHPETIKRPTSSHPQGFAADIAASGSPTRYQVAKALLDAGFSRIGIGETFIHVDSDPSKVQGVIWDYY